MTEPVLSIRGLRLKAQLRDTSFAPVTDAHVTVRPGEIVGLVGESGSGKTLTALSALRLMPANISVESGSITIDERDVLSLTESELARVRGSVASIVFQDSLGSLNPSIRVERQVAEAITAHESGDQRSAMARAHMSLSHVGFPLDRATAYPHQLSGGLRQRVAIAIATACRPKLLIADEPTTALDVTVQAQILTLLRSLADELGLGVLLITHDLGVVATIADRVTVMYGGRTVEACSVTDVFATPAHPYSDALVRSAPSLDDDRDLVLRGIPGQPPDPRTPEPGCPFEPRCDRRRAECSHGPIPLTVNGAERMLACLNPVISHG